MNTRAPQSQASTGNEVTITNLVLRQRDVAQLSWSSQVSGNTVRCLRRGRSSLQVATDIRIAGHCGLSFGNRGRSAGSTPALRKTPRLNSTVPVCSGPAKQTPAVLGRERCSGRSPGCDLVQVLHKPSGPQPYLPQTAGNFLPRRLALLEQPALHTRPEAQPVADHSRFSQWGFDASHVHGDDTVTVFAVMVVVTWQRQQKRWLTHRLLTAVRFFRFCQIARQRGPRSSASESKAPAIMSVEQEGNAPDEKMLTCKMRSEAPGP